MQVIQQMVPDDRNSLWNKIMNPAYSHKL